MYGKRCGYPQKLSLSSSAFQSVENGDADLFLCMWLQFATCFFSFLTDWNTEPPKT